MVAFIPEGTRRVQSLREGSERYLPALADPRNERPFVRFQDSVDDGKGCDEDGRDLRAS